MKEIILENNYIGKQILVNGIPDLSKIPEETLSCFVKALVERIKSGKQTRNF